jgi:predicted amidophosphoribosyltransferase
LLEQQLSTSADHLQDTGRRTPEAIAGNYRIAEVFATPEPTHIWVIDDVLTTGAHFKAAQRVLLGRFPQAHVFGVFVARRVPPPDEEVDWDDL